MKTVLFLIPTLGGGGAEKVLVNLANNLDKNKYDVSIQTIFKAGINSQFLNENVHLLEGRFKQFSGNVLLQKFFSPRFLYERIVKKRYDIVVSYLEGVSMRIVAGCPFADSQLLAWIHVEHNSSAHASSYYRSYKEACLCNERFKKIICVAKSVEDNFNAWFHQESKTQVLYNILEVDAIQKRGAQSIPQNFFSNEINVVSVGRLIEQKGYDRLAIAHKRLLDEGLKHHIYILGNGNRKYITSLIHQLGVSSTFHLLGFEKNPYKYISKADVFVCSSRREGFSTAVTEALILGVPIVSTLVSGAQELLGDNNEFGIVTENSEEGIYFGLYEMLNKPQLRKSYRQQALLRGKGFSKESTIKAVEQMFDSL